MPGPIIGGQGFENPPEEMRVIIGENAYQYFVMIHTLLFKGRNNELGILDKDNIIGDLTDTTDHALLTNVQPYQHHGSDKHDGLTQARSIASVSVTTVLVDSADAGAAYTAAEQALVNELKSDLNTLASSMNTLVAKVNELITALKAADLMA